jgi:hypothetical protein
MILIGRTMSGSSGSYSIGLSARSASVLVRSASLHGIVNFELAVASRDGTADYSFPRRLAATTHGLRLAALYSAPGRPEIATLRVDGATRSGRYRPDRVCVRHHRLLFNFRERWEPFGATYSTTSGVKQGFTYIDGQNTTFSVGSSATGKKGSFTLDGSFSLENSSATSVTPPSAKGPALRKYDTKVVNGKYYVYYTNADCGLPVFKTWPNDYPGGGKTFRPRKAPAARHCEPYGAGYLYRKTTTKAETFEKGFTIPAIEFTVSTQTGWSHTAVLWYRIGHRGRHLCGTTAKPGNKPRAVVEKR